MRIAFVVHEFAPDPLLGGTGRYAVSLAQALRAMGHEILIFALGAENEHFSESEESYEGMPTWRVSHRLPTTLEETIGDPAVGEALDRWLDHHPVDMVHFHHTIVLGMDLPARVKRRGIPVVLTLHDFWLTCHRIFLNRPQPDGSLSHCAPPVPQEDCASCIAETYRLSDVGAVMPFVALRESLGKEAIAAADLVLCASDYTRRTFEEGLGWPGQYVTLPFGIAPFTPMPSPKLKSDIPTFGFMANIAKIKGLEVLLEAFRTVADRACLMVFGEFKDADPGYYQLLKRLSADLPSVSFHGSYEQGELPKLLSLMDALVIPSMHESFGLVALEAFAAGVPVIASEVGGLPEIVSHGVNGLHFRRGDARELAQILQRLVSDPPQLAALRQGVPPVKTMTTHAREVGEHYARVLGRHAASRPRVLALLHSLDPCPRIRLLYPLQEAERQGGLEFRSAPLFDPDYQHPQLMADIDWADVVVFQRLGSAQHVSLMAYCQEQGKRVVFETDDDLLNLPPSNPHHEAFQQPELRGVIETLIRQADLVTVSTAPLSDALASLNARRVVIPNALHGPLFPSINVDARHGHGPIVIGYAGTPTHREDLRPVLPALQRLLVERPEEIRLVFMGCIPDELRAHPGVSAIPETADYEAFIASLCRSGIQIGLAPLMDQPFNRSKSPIKWMEYAMSGIASVCSAVGPYAETVVDGEDALLVSGTDAEEWYQALIRLVDDPALRLRLAKTAHQRVRERHLLSVAAARWAEAYRSVLQPEVSIVIPLYNKVEYTARCLETLVQYTPAVRYEVILVDNASSDATPELLGQLEGDVRVIVNPQNLGFAKACNQGAAIAKGRYILFLNNDTEPQDGWLEPLVKVLDEDPQVGVVGARLLYPDGTLQHAGVTVVEDLRQGLPLNCLHRYHRLPADHAPANQRSDVQVVTGAALMIRRELFHKVGGFDEGYWNGNEDVDLCFTLGQQGWRIVYEPESCLVHHESVSGPERWRKVNENIQRLLQRWVGRIVPDELIAADGTVLPHPARLSSRDVPASSERVSIVLLGYNQLAYTRLCVESVLEHSDVPFELLLIDNGSVDGTGEYFRELASRDARVKAILNPRNLGFAVGCNQGIAEATGDYILFLNNDTIVPRQWLSRLLAHFKERPAVGAVGAVSNCVSGPQQLQSVPVPNHPEAREDILAFGETIASSMRGKGFELGRLVGFCLMVRRDVLDRIGGFDPRFGIGNFEDDDLCLRVLTAGFRTWVAQDVYVHHFGSRTFAALGLHAYTDTMDQGWELFKQKWGLAPHLDRRHPYLVDIPTFEPLRHVVPTRKTIPEDLAEPFRPGILPMSLPECRQVAFFHHPDWSAGAWEQIVASYVRAFAPSEDVSLVLWLDPSQGVGLEEATARVMDLLAREGFDSEHVPDLLLVPDILDLEGLAQLYAAVDVVVPGGDPLQALRAERLGRDVLSVMDMEAWRGMACQPDAENGQLNFRPSLPNS